MGFEVFRTTCKCGFKVIHSIEYPNGMPHKCIGKTAKTMELQEENYYWIQQWNCGKWEIGHYDTDGEKMKFCNGGSCTVKSIWKIDHNPISK